MRFFLQRLHGPWASMHLSVSLTEGKTGSADSFKCFGTLTSRNAVYCMIEGCLVWTRSCKILDALRRKMAKANRIGGQPPLLAILRLPFRSLRIVLTTLQQVRGIVPNEPQSMFRSTRRIAPPGMADLAATSRICSMAYQASPPLHTTSAISTTLTPTVVFYST